MKRGGEREERERRGRRETRATEAYPGTVKRRRQRGGDCDQDTMLRRKRSVSFGGFGW